MQSSSALWEITERLGEMACLREEQKRLVAHRRRGVEPGEGVGSGMSSEGAGLGCEVCDGVVTSEHCEPHGCEVALDQRRVPKGDEQRHFDSGRWLGRGLERGPPTAWRGR